MALQVAQTGESEVPSHSTVDQAADGAILPVADHAQEVFDDELSDSQDGYHNVMFAEVGATTVSVSYIQWPPYTVVLLQFIFLYASQPGHGSSFSSACRYDHRQSQHHTAVLSVSIYSASQHHTVSRGRTTVSS